MSFRKRASAGLAVILFVALASCSTATQRNGRVLVAVVDARCGYPLPGVRVGATSDRGKHAETVADGNGIATFVLHAGKWQFTPALEGAHGAETAAIRVLAGAEHHAEVALELERPGSIVVEPHGPCQPRQKRVNR